MLYLSGMVPGVIGSSTEERRPMGWRYRFDPGSMNIACLANFSNYPIERTIKGSLFSLIEQPNEKIPLNAWLFRGISLNSYVSKHYTKL